MDKAVRLEKFLSERNIGTRSQIKEMGKKGRITVNGKVENKTDVKITPSRDQVMVDGQLLSGERFEYVMLHKPQGVVSATKDNLHQTVLDLLKGDCRKDFFPVGRLDIDTEGLLLITNDGELAHHLLSPRKHVDKVYFAKVEGTLPEDAVRQFQNGICLKDQTQMMPAKLVIEERGHQISHVRLTIHEGKFHQVKRMFEALDCQVVYLKRLSMGSLSLDEQLEPGQYRPLTDSEIKQLKDGCHVNE